MASGTISAREAVSVNPQRSIFLPYRQFPYLGLQCSSPALSSHPACHKEDRLFYLSFLPVHPIQLLRPHRTKYQLIKIHSGALEQEKSGMECAFSLLSPMLHSGYSPSFASSRRRETKFWSLEIRLVLILYFIIPIQPNTL